MKRFTAILAVIVLAILSQAGQAADVQATTVPIAESSYVKITNFSGWYYTYSIEPGGPPRLAEWKGFYAEQAHNYKSLPTIEAKVINFMHPGSPPAGYWDSKDNGLLFDCHSGNANVGDFASASPLVMCGLEPWKRVEFDWVSNISASAAPYLCIEVAGYPGTPYVEQVQWRLRPGVGLRTGHTVIDIHSPGIVDAVSLRLAIEPVPEPGSIVALGLGMSWLMLRRRMKA